jgi:glycosyltransferase involved in cell wall biosynthesis
MSAFVQRIVHMFYTAVALVPAVRRVGVLNLIVRGRSRVAHGAGPGHAPDNHSPVTIDVTGFAMRALVIDAYLPMPDRDSGSGRKIRVLELLQSFGFGVSFAAAGLDYQYPYADRLLKMGIDVLFTPQVRSLKAWLDEHGSALSLVILSRANVASRYLGLVRKFCPNARVIFDTEDLHYLREQRQAEIEHSWLLSACAGVRKRQELGLTCMADHTLVVSEFEREVLLGEKPDLPVSVLSNIHEAHGRTTDFDHRTGLLFIGNFSHPPNVDAMQHFVSRIFPHIRARLPDVELTIIGSNMGSKLNDCEVPGVRLAGYVEDIVPHLERARISVAPLRFGAGVKGKVNLSMSYGLPVVATPVAAEGMGTVSGRNILIAGDEAEFAAQVVALYQDKRLWNGLSTQGLELIESRYSVNVAKTALAEVLTSLSLPATLASARDKAVP